MSTESTESVGVEEFTSFDLLTESTESVGVEEFSLLDSSTGSAGLDCSNSISIGVSDKVPSDA